MGSPVLWGPNNIANNLQSQELLASGALLAWNGPKNYITLGNFENGLTTGWSLGTVGTLTNGIPTGTPTFGSGASGNLSISTVSSGQLSGNYSLSYASSAATTQGNMLASQVYNIDPADQAKVLTYKCYYSVFSGAANANFSGTSSNSFGIAAYDVTNSSWLSLAGNFAMTQNSGVGYATGTCQTNSNTTQIRFVLYNANATSGAITLYLDDFFLGPQTAPYGPAMTDWQNYTLNITGSVSNPSKVSNPAIDLAYWRRVGDSMEIVYTYDATGTTSSSAGSGNYYFNLPSGYSIDSNKVTLQTGLNHTSNGGVGTCSVLDSTGEGTMIGYVSAATSTALCLVVWSGHDTTVQGNIVGQASGSGLLSNSTCRYTFTARVPIAGWSSNVQMSSDSSTAVVDFKGTNASTQAVTANVTNLAFTAIKDSNGAWNGTQYVVPVTGDYAILLSFSDSSTNTYNIRAWVNGVADAYIATTNSGHYGSGGTLLTGIKAGDLISVRSDSTQTIGANAYLSIFRLSGPSAIAATETVSARYHGSTSSVSGSDATVVWTTKDWDDHLIVNPSTGVVTIPVSGKYQVNASVLIAGTYAVGNANDLQIQKNGTDVSRDYVIAGGSINNLQVQCSDIISCLAGDTIQVQISSAATSPSINTNNNFANTFFSIARVGN